MIVNTTSNDCILINTTWYKSQHKWIFHYSTTNDLRGILVTIIFLFLITHNQFTSPPSLPICYIRTNSNNNNINLSSNKLSHDNTSVQKENICQLKYIMNYSCQRYHKSIKFFKRSNKHISKTYKVYSEKLCKICRRNIYLRHA